MAERRKGVRGIAAILAVLAATLGGAATEISAQEQKPAAETQPAAAQASEAAKGPNTGRLSISAGDWRGTTVGAHARRPKSHTRPRSRKLPSANDVPDP